MTTNLADCDAPAGGFDREDATLIVEGVVFSGSSPVVQLQGDGSTQRVLPAMSAVWDPVTNPYITGVQFEYAPVDGAGETILTSPQPPGAEAWKTSNAIVGGATYSARYRAVGVANTYGSWSTPEDVTIADDAGPFVGDGEPAFVPVEATAIYQRQDESEFWRYDDTVEATSGENIVATNLKSGTNTITLTGFAATQVARFSKPLAAASGGLLTWDGYSAWSSDGSTSPVPPPVVGQTWSNEFEIWGSNDSFATHDVLFTAGLDANLYATAAAAFAAISARLPFSATGYTEYRIVGIIDPNPSDNRGGLSVMVETIKGWVLMSDLNALMVNGVEIDPKTKTLNFAGGIVTGSTDGDGNVTVTVNTDTDGTLAANSDAKAPTQKAVKTYVDAKVAGLSWKQAVRVATTAAGTLSSSFENGDTVDGVVLATGNRILIKNQAAAAENGIYTVNASGAPTRATDADSGTELVNATCYVSEGTTNADTQWTCTTNATITVGSTSLTFAQLTTGGGTIGGTTGSNDNRLLRSDGTGGATVQASAIEVDDDGGIKLPATFALTGDISPSQITSNQNDYNPTSLATSTVLRLTSDASRDITGLQGGADGRLLVIQNVGSFDIVLKDESASSAAAYRFALDGDLTLSADTTATLIYDSTSSRWRLVAVGKVAGAGAITVKDEGSNLTTALASIDFTGAGVTATNSGGAVTVNIPGGGGHFYEKFGALPLASSFTGVSAANHTLTDGNLSLLDVWTASGANQCQLYKKAAPSTPYDVYMRTRMFTGTGSVNVQHGLVVRASATGKFALLAMNYQGIIGVQEWTNATTFSSQIVAAVSVFNPYATSSLFQPFWLRIKNDGTTLTFYWSVDGDLWLSLGTRTLATFLGTCDEIGFGGVPQSAGSAWISSFGTAAPT